MMSKLSVFVCTGVVAMVIASASPPAMSAETVLYSFEGHKTGEYPSGGLIANDAGDFFGVTAGGGRHKTCIRDSRCGTVFELGPDGTETVLYSFKGGITDGGLPYFGLVADASGNLYGVTSLGGGNDEGTVFRLAPDGTEAVLHSFHGGSDGTYPSGKLLLDKKGYLFGTTEGGGAGNLGTVFEVTPEGKEKVLYGFCSLANCTDGSEPGGITRDAVGNLYGTTFLGGDPSCDDGYGCGIVFRLSRDGTEAVLYTFQGGSDGEFPGSGLLVDKSGNLYGTTQFGGADKSCVCGTVFKVTPDGAETILHSFKGGMDGQAPAGNLIMDEKGDLYGATEFGGGHGCAPQYYGCGTVFKVAPDGKETVLFAFDRRDGNYPEGPLLLRRPDMLYGLAGGGTYHRGVVFSVTTK